MVEIFSHFWVALFWQRLWCQIATVPKACCQARPSGMGWLIPGQPSILWFWMRPFHTGTGHYPWTQKDWKATPEFPLFAEPGLSGCSWNTPLPDTSSIHGMFGLCSFIGSFLFLDFLRSEPSFRQKGTFNSYTAFLVTKKEHWLPWWCSGWESACQFRGHRFEPWSRKIPHAARQLSPCTTTTEPVL